MHVLLLPSWYKTPEEPVLGSFFEEQARALAAEGARVGILHPQLLPFGERLRGGTPPLPPDAVDSGLPVVRAQARSIVPRLRALNTWWLERVTARALARYEAQFGRPDLLHAHSTFFGGVAAARLSRRGGRPFVLTEHLSAIVDPSWPARRAEGQILRDTFARADRALVVSVALREALGRFGVDLSRVEVMPNMVSPSFFEGVEPAPAGTGFTWFTVSFLIPRKRIDLLMRAFALASAGRPELRLRIGGDGPERARLEILAQELGIADRVELLGRLSRGQVRDELARCHAFVLASAFETFGVVAAEALAAGRPVVATDSGGVRDVLGPGDGLLVSEKSPEALAAALEATRAGRAEHDAAELSRRCRERFSPESVARRLLRVYEEELSRRGDSSAERA